MAYTRVNWENLPSTKTPVNADNLNKMDKGIKDLETEVDEKETLINNAINQTKTELQNNINEISKVQVLQLNLVPNTEYIDSKNFITWGIRIGKLVYIAVEFGWKKVFTTNDNNTIFISGFPTNLKTPPYVYPTDTISGHKYRMRISEGNLLNWWANVKDINYGDSANKVQRLEILGYLQN